MCNIYWSVEGLVRKRRGKNIFSERGQLFRIGKEYDGKNGYNSLAFSFSKGNFC